MLLELLAEVKDPELPVIDIVELGIVRDVVVDGDSVRVDVTPTYSGCPAMQVIEQDIVPTLERARLRDVQSALRLFACVDDRLALEETKQKLRDYGIAPPTGVDTGGIAELVSLRRARPTIDCPFCGSANTERKASSDRPRASRFISATAVTSLSITSRLSDFYAWPVALLRIEPIIPPNCGCEA